jgi:hypothetical protein
VMSGSPGRCRGARMGHSRPTLALGEHRPAAQRDTADRGPTCRPQRSWGAIPSPLLAVLGPDRSRPSSTARWCGGTIYSDPRKRTSAHDANAVDKAGVRTFDRSPPPAKEGFRDGYRPSIENIPWWDALGTVTPALTSVRFDAVHRPQSSVST